MHRLAVLDVSRPQPHHRQQLVPLGDRLDARTRLGDLVGRGAGAAHAQVGARRAKPARILGSVDRGREHARRGHLVARKVRRVQLEAVDEARDA